MTCNDCGHRAHRSPKYGGGGCMEWIDNGWTRHGCHCEGGELPAPRWIARKNEKGLPDKDMTGTVAA